MSIKAIFGRVIELLSTGDLHNTDLGVRGDIVTITVNPRGCLYTQMITTDPTNPSGPGQVISSAPIFSDGNDFADANALLVGNYNFGYNDFTAAWDRLRASGNNADGVAAKTLGILDTVSFAYVWNGATWDRWTGSIVGVWGDNADAQATVTTGLVRSRAEVYGFNGTTFDRIRSQGNNASGVAPVSLGVLDTAAFTYVWNGASWDRWTGAITGTSVVVGGTADNADAVAVTTNAALRTTAENYGFNGTTWDRIRSGGNNASGVAVSTLGNLQTLGFNYIYNGTSWDRWTGAITQIGTSGTDRSGSIAVANTSQQAMAANTSRTEAWVANPSALTESIFINITGAAAVVNGQGSIEIPPGTGWAGSVTNQINVIATTAGHVYTAGER